MVNIVVLRGYVKDEPQLKVSKTRDGKAYEEAIVKITHKGLRERFYTTATCLGRGKIKDLVISDYHKGDQVVIEGSLSAANNVTLSMISHIRPEDVNTNYALDFDE